MPTPRNASFNKLSGAALPAAPFGDVDPPTIPVAVFSQGHSVATPPPSSERRLSQLSLSDAFRSASERTANPGLGAPPQVGDTILGFELVEELGQGAFARVFLARQESLARRPVALKVTLRPTREAERLARLQHTHIVPVYSVHDAAPVQVICMPYLGRRTIADLIRAFRADLGSRALPYRKTSGTRPARTTTSPDAPSLPKSSSGSGPHPTPLALKAGEELPVLIGEPKEVLRILVQLASGLSHAHERGILHLDLKPANVLLADTGEAMLLDFNLSFDASNPERELVGGTVPYMSPEQLKDLQTRGKGRVDARTDLYSLGVMAFEMLVGTVPFPASLLADIDGLIAARRKGPPSIQAHNPAVSPAVESIIRKLLEPDPEDRYQSAEQFRTDLERQLNDRPLAFAREGSLLERIGKWHRRNPRLPGRALAASFLGLSIGAGTVAHARSEAHANAQAVVRAASTHASLDRMRLDLILPGDSAARKRGLAAAEELLASYGLPDEENWQQNEEVSRLSEKDRTELGGDLGEVLLLAAQARWQKAEGQSDADRRELALSALAAKSAAKKCFSSGTLPPSFDRLASHWSLVAGEAAEGNVEGNAKRQLNARECFLDAAADVACGRYASAIASLEKTIEDQPSHAAAQFCLAYCRQQLGQYDRALERYDAARVLMPTDPRPLFQSGSANAMLLKYAAAESQFSRALALDAEFELAYRHRAIVRCSLGKWEGAEEDLTSALSHRGPAIQIHLIRADVRTNRGNAAGAKADRDAAAELKPQLEGDYLVFGLYRMKEDPKAALAAFRSAAALNPRSVSAIVNEIHVLADVLKDPSAALLVATKATELHPEYAPGKSSRAIILARLGRRAEAHKEMEEARSISETPEILFRAACVYSLTSATHPEDGRKALDLLKSAIRKGYRNATELKGDPDLKPIRSLPEYREIVRAESALE